VKKQKRDPLPGQKGSKVKGKRTEGWLLTLPQPERLKPKSDFLLRLEARQNANKGPDSQKGVVTVLRRQAD
jgi:hypothetical protein